MQKQHWWLAGGILLTFAVDWLGKCLATKLLTHAIVLPFFAFGIPFPLPLTILLSFAAITLFLYIYIKQTQQNPLATLSFALIIGGSLGNLIERVLNAEVTDFITLWFIPNFNLADAALTIGIFLLIIGYRKIFSS